MSSTSSSAEQGVPKRSATEALASRYRHLFVLPSTPFLLIYALIISLFVSVASRGTFGVGSLLPALVVFVLSASAISSALLIADRKTIATFRRTTAVLLAGEILWLFCVVCGVVYTWLRPSPYTLTNAILFGAFVCAGLEFLVINGAFIGSAPLSMSLAAIHPVSTLAIIRLAELSNHLDVLAVFFGSVAFGIIVAFTFLLGSRRTSRGHSALSLFRSFMKTWAAGEAADLEAIISDHSEAAQVTTKVLHFQTQAGSTYIVLPGVHPGPFHPVGSYDLPGVLSRAFEGLGHVMTLHRPGGHEKNLATTKETLGYAEQVREFARAIIPTAGEAVIRGPLHSRIGNATVSSSAFSNDLVLTISFSPLGSEDLSAGIEDEFARLGMEAGFDTYAVDAHNSIDHRHESPDTNEAGWKELFGLMRKEEGRQFRFAYSHSSEFNFRSGGDLTENGIGLAMFEANRAMSVLILADANNAVSSLRSEAARALESSGYGLIEFCTSDSHNLAARGLTVARGYQALGEEIRVESIANLIVEMAKSAETKLLPCSYASGKVATRVKVFGPKALEEFAGITQSSSRLGRYYLRFAGIAVGVLLLLSLFL